MTKLEQFNKAIVTVNDERGAVYDHPFDDFGRADLIKSAVAHCGNARIRHVLEMIGLKLVRLAKTPDHMDSWIDIAGYARTGVMILDRVDEIRKELNIHSTQMTTGINGVHERDA